MERILGQDRAVDQLLRAIASGRVHHAWVFAGPRGVGKFTTALEFAKLLLDPAAGPDLTGRWSVDPHGTIAARVDSGNHPDLHVIRKELALISDNPALRTRKLSNIPVDLLREHMIGGKGPGDRRYEPVVFHSPSMGSRKVFIIDEAELLDATGQNALLKTLEEPPTGTHLVLVTSRPEQLLPTIHSRAQLVRFRLLPPAAMNAWMDRERLAADDPMERAWITAFADGSPGVAKLAADHGFHAWETQIDPLLARVERGGWPTDLGDAMAALVDEFAAGWVKVHANASKDAANKDGAAHLLGLLAARLRRTLKTATSPGGGDTGPVLARIEAVHRCELELAANVNLKQAFEGLAVAWARAAEPPAASVPVLDALLAGG